MRYITKKLPNFGRQLGFTLVELLVVIAIIALLLSILMPSLQAARNQARTLVCISNQKQFGVAAQMYMSETSYVPPVQENNKPSIMGTSNGAIFFEPKGSLGPYLYNAKKKSMSGSYSFKDGVNPLKCPSYAGKLGDTTVFGTYAVPMLGLNADICYFASWKTKSYTPVWVKAMNLKSPSIKVLMTDIKPDLKTYDSFFCTNYYSVYPGYGSLYWDYRHNPRGRQSANNPSGIVVLYLDGHVSREQKMPITPDAWGYHEARNLPIPDSSR